MYLRITTIIIHMPQEPPPLNTSFLLSPHRCSLVSSMASAVPEHIGPLLSRETIMSTTRQQDNVLMVDSPNVGVGNI